MEDGWALLAAAEEGKNGEGKKKTPPLLPLFGGVVLLIVCPRSSSPFSTPSSSSVFPLGSRWGGGKLLGVGMTKYRTRQLTFSEKDERKNLHLPPPSKIKLRAIEMVGNSSQKPGGTEKGQKSGR